MALLEAFRQKHEIADDFKGDMLLVRMATLAGIRCDAEYLAWGRYLYRDREAWSSGGPLRLGLGKYCGNTLAEVLEKDHRYCTWFAENCFDGAPEAARKLILHAWGMA